MLERAIVARYLISARHDPHDNNSDQYWVCGYLAEQLIMHMSAEELPEFLVCNDKLMREVAQDRLKGLSYVGG